MSRNNHLILKALVFSLVFFAGMGFVVFQPVYASNTRILPNGIGSSNESLETLVRRAIHNYNNGGLFEHQFINNPTGMVLNEWITSAPVHPGPQPQAPSCYQYNNCSQEDLETYESALNNWNIEYQNYRNNFNTYLLNWSKGRIFKSSDMFSSASSIYATTTVVHTWPPAVGTAYRQSGTIPHYYFPATTNIYLNGRESIVWRGNTSIINGWMNIYKANDLGSPDNGSVAINIACGNMIISEKLPTTQLEKLAFIAGTNNVVTYVKRGDIIDYRISVTVFENANHLIIEDLLPIKGSPMNYEIISISPELTIANYNYCSTNSSYFNRPCTPVYPFTPTSSLTGDDWDRRPLIRWWFGSVSPGTVTVSFRIRVLGFCVSGSNPFGNWVRNEAAAISTKSGKGTSHYNLFLKSALLAISSDIRNVSTDEPSGSNNFASRVDAREGQVIEARIRITNTGNYQAVNVRTEASLPPNMHHYQTFTGGGVAFINDRYIMDASLIGTGSTVEFRYQMIVGFEGMDGGWSWNRDSTRLHTARITYAEQAGLHTNHQSCGQIWATTSTIVLKVRARLHIKKEVEVNINNTNTGFIEPRNYNDVDHPVYPGQLMAYRLTIRNYGQDMARNIMFIDNIPAHTKFEKYESHGYVAGGITRTISGSTATVSGGDFRYQLPPNFLLNPDEEFWVVFWVRVDYEMSNYNIDILNENPRAEYMLSPIPMIYGQRQHRTSNSTFPYSQNENRIQISTFGSQVNWTSWEAERFFRLRNPVRHMKREVIKTFNNLTTRQYVLDRHIRASEYFWAQEEDTVRFNISFTNDGKANQQNVWLKDFIPKHMTFVPNSMTSNITPNIRCNGPQATGSCIKTDDGPDTPNQEFVLWGWNVIPGNTTVNVSFMARIPRNNNILCNEVVYNRFNNHPYENYQCGSTSGFTPSTHPTLLPVPMYNHGARLWWATAPNMVAPHPAPKNFNEPDCNLKYPTFGAPPLGPEYSPLYSNVIAVRIHLAPNLEIDKYVNSVGQYIYGSPTNLNSGVQKNEEIAYIIELKNTGRGEAANVVIESVVPYHTVPASNLIFEWHYLPEFENDPNKAHLIYGETDPIRVFLHNNTNPRVPAGLTSQILWPFSKLPFSEIPYGSGGVTRLPFNANDFQLNGNVMRILIEQVPAGAVLRVRYNVRVVDTPYHGLENQWNTEWNANINTAHESALRNINAPIVPKNAVMDREALHNVAKVWAEGWGSINEFRFSQDPDVLDLGNTLLDKNDIRSHDHAVIWSDEVNGVVNNNKRTRVYISIPDLRIYIWADTPNYLTKEQNWTVRVLNRGSRDAIGSSIALLLAPRISGGPNASDIIITPNAFSNITVPALGSWASVFTTRQSNEQTYRLVADIMWQNGPVNWRILPENGGASWIVPLDLPGENFYHDRSRPTNFLEHNTAWWDLYIFFPYLQTSGGGVHSAGGFNMGAGQNLWGIGCDMTNPSHYTNPFCNNADWLVTSGRDSLWTNFFTSGRFTEEGIPWAIRNYGNIYVPNVSTGIGIPISNLEDNTLFKNLENPKYREGLNILAELDGSSRTLINSSSIGNEYVGRLSGKTYFRRLGNLTINSLEGLGNLARIADANTMLVDITDNNWCKAADKIGGICNKVKYHQNRPTATIIIDGNLTINGNITYHQNNTSSGYDPNTGQGVKPAIPSLGLLVTGDIIISQNVTRIDAVLHSDRTITILSNNHFNEPQFTLNGSMIANRFVFGRKHISYQGWESRRLPYPPGTPILTGPNYSPFPVPNNNPQIVHEPNWRLGRQPAERIIYSGQIQIQIPPGFEYLPIHNTEWSFEEPPRIDGHWQEVVR